CACDYDKGISFCVYKALGKMFVQKKFLKCEAGNGQFDASKMPPASALMMPNENGSLPDPTSGSSGSGGSGSKPSVLLPLATAAAMLLRH
ncbi:hypothetical protein PMAYCL1PPCAC_13732, partial [Pristionchus mayeri]